MASALLRNCINALKNHTRIPFSPAELVPLKVREATHVTKPSLVQPCTTTAERLMMNSQNSPLPDFKIDEYRTMKANQINKALDEAVPLQHPTLLHEAMRYTLLAGGKRVFGTLCIASCELVGGNESVGMPLACAAEMLVTMAVIQDDLPCLDNDDFRRGKPANHKVFGEATAVLACQALLCLAIEHLATKTKVVSTERLLRAIVEICSAAGPEGAAAGQMMDINSEGKEVSLSELESIHRHKCGKFIEASIVSGVLVGGGNEEELQRLRKYGRCVGLAYQVWDDIIDTTGSPVQDMGKKPGRDLLRDKATYPKIMGIDEAKNYARELVAEANKELAYFDSSKVAPLHHMANFIVSRPY
ncbi:Geranylgeranyl pyrophosphate synthase [Melia azedarach]|uniref:Geranylgeranyl pyrophosphate synthase n=1 Tax=Melia azedarach TaxID=155640 RepID=A0ACC1X644_MELAZ|nr:Geranylgeranyl pyrophosphate synthase [Melia azedarach]